MEDMQDGGMKDPMQPPAPGKSQQRHPIHTIQDILNNTPPDMIEHEYKQSSDGSIEIKIKIPGRAEQAKQRAMQQAEQAMQQAGVNPAGSMPGDALKAGKPSAGPAQMQQPDQANKAAGTSTNVVVKVAMTPKDVGQTLKSNGYPEAFLKNMGLL